MRKIFLAPKGALGMGIFEARLTIQGVPKKRIIYQAAVLCKRHFFLGRSVDLFLHLSGSLGHTRALSSESLSGSKQIKQIREQDSESDQRVSLSEIKLIRE